MKLIQGKWVCETIDEVLAPDQCALLVIDMQNDALSPEGKFAEAGNDISGMLEILPRCRHVLEEARRLGIFIVHIRVLTLRDGKSDSPSWIRAKGLAVNTTDFFLEGSWGSEIVEELKPLDGEVLVTKRRSSAFVGTDLDAILRANDVKTVVVIGEQTPGCIEATYRDAAYHDYYNVLIEDCVAAFDKAQHEASLLIQRARHDVCDSETLLRIWREARTKGREEAPLPA